MVRNQKTLIFGFWKTISYYRIPKSKAYVSQIWGEKRLLVESCFSRSRKKVFRFAKRGASAVVSKQSGTNSCHWQKKKVKLKKNCFLGRKSSQVSVSLVSVTKMSIGQPKAGFLPPKLKFELTKTSRKYPKFEINFALETGWTPWPKS